MSNNDLKQAEIRFELSFPEAQAHYAAVKIHIDHNVQSFIDLKLPTWSPGSYLIREYARHIERFQVRSTEGKSLFHQKINKNTWRIYTEEAANLLVEYAVYGFETSVRTNFFDADHAFVVPTATFMYIDGLLHMPVLVTIHPVPHWKVISTGLSCIDKHTYTAPDFDILYDSPIEIGNQEVWSFRAAGVQHDCAMVGGGTYDIQRLTQDITSIIEEETRIWGSNPNDYYVFITHNYQSGGGGLEHLNSCVLGASRNAYASEQGYKNYLSLVAHEYFHLWNVKRLRPKALGPFNYDGENYTTSLWMMEGFTAYYDNLVIKRCGFITEAEYLKLLANEFNLVLNRPGHQIQSAAAASFDTWIKFYRPDENSINSGISYYNKGAMLSAMLDIKIIAATAGEMKLDNVLRAAYQNFFLDQNRGFEENEFQVLAEQIVGISLDDIFSAAYSECELDYNSYFNLVGYEIIDLNRNNRELSLGITTSKTDGLTLVSSVEKGSGAYDAGLNVKDELIAINQVRLDSRDKEYEFFLSNGKEGDNLNILLSRDGLIREIAVELRRNTKQLFEIRKLSEQTFLQEMLGEKWLS